MASLPNTRRVLTPCDRDGTGRLRQNSSHPVPSEPQVPQVLRDCTVEVNGISLLPVKLRDNRFILPSNGSPSISCCSTPT